MNPSKPAQGPTSLPTPPLKAPSTMAPPARGPLQPMRPPKKPRNLKQKIILLFGGVLVLVVLSLGLFAYLYSNAQKTATPQTPTPTPSVPAISYNQPKVVLQFFATGVPNPTDIAATGQADDKNLYVTDRTGIIRVVQKDGIVAKDVFLDISSLVLNDGEQGLLSMAFSPNYKNDGFFYVNYIDKAQNTVVARYRAAAGGVIADPATAQTVLTIKQPYPNHKAGDLAFGVDGYLYIAVGDGGSAGDPENHAQNQLDLLGKILRIDVSTLPYKIPPTNPYAKPTKKQAPEVWAYGLRNPWRMSFDRKTKELYIADVGQGASEEVNIESAGDKGGHNYGWRCYEGTHEYNAAGCGPISQYQFPAFEYDHSQERCAITGGFAYRGEEDPSLLGKYFYADYCSGQVYYAEKKSGAWAQTPATKTTFSISTFGENNAGELYAADFKSGSLFRIKDLAN